MTLTDSNYRTFIESTLAELNSQKMLRASEESIENIHRRPYLNKKERDCVIKLPESVLKEYFRSGEFLHVPMTQEERGTFEKLIKFNRKKGSEEITEEELEMISEMLPGRTGDDLQKYLDDLDNGADQNNSILIFTCENWNNSALPTDRIQNSNWTRFLQKQFSIFESSGCVTQIACRTGNQNPRIMIGACATQEERYNRVGEILMAYNEKHLQNDHKNSGYGVLILDGHKKMKSTPTGQVMMRQTVTCIVYDPLSDLFFSGGYDGDVVAWSAKEATAIETIGSHPKPINSIACHGSRNLIAYGCQSGGLHCFSSFSDLGTKKARPVTLFTKPKPKDSFNNTVDHVSIPATGLKSNFCYAGIGFLQSASAGVIEAWDLETGSLSTISERLQSGLSCMNVSACGTMLAAGTGCIASDDIKGDGIVRIMSLNNDLKTSLSIKSTKYDLDCVSFCPKSNLLFMGETSDCSVAVYDLRFPSEPLFATSHGTVGADSMVAHAWLSNGDILATGGHNGQVKLWDCKRSFNLLNTFEFNSSITCITFSEADRTIWIGTDNGGVYSLASQGSIGEGHQPVLSGKCVY